MGTRGRKSAGDLMQLASNPVAVQRPDAPYDLDDEGAAEWQRVVEAMPADWFGPETFALLADYCRHVVSARHMSQLVAQLQKAPGVDMDGLDKALKMRERETRAASSLATRLRITKQATQRADKAVNRTLVQAPWQT